MRMQIIVFFALIALSSGGYVLAATDGNDDSLSAPTECTLVPKARIDLMRDNGENSTSKLKSALRLANFGHEISTGSGYVLSFRQFLGGDAPVDAAKYLKVTLALPSDSLTGLDGKEKRVQIKDGYYIEGSVGFVYKGEYWQAHLPLAEVTLQRTSGALTALLHLNFPARYVATGESKSAHLELSCRIEEKSVSSLSSWEGKPGADWKSFAPSALGSGPH